MSAKITAWAWNLHFDVTSHKLVMLQLADNADSEGLCYPFVKRIAMYTCLSERQVQKILKILEQNGYISREERFKRNRQQSSNCYQIHHQKTSHRTLSCMTGVNSTTPMGELQDTPPPVADDTPPPLKNDENFNKNNTVTKHDASVTKSFLTKNITKRESAPSVDNFIPDENNLFLARDLKVDVALELKSFKERHKGEKTQYEFGRWLKSAKQYQDRKHPQEESNRPKYRDFTQERLDREAAELKGFSDEISNTKHYERASNGSEATGNYVRGDYLRKAKDYLLS